VGLSLSPLEGVAAFTGVQHEELTELKRNRFWRALQPGVRASTEARLKVGHSPLWPEVGGETAAHTPHPFLKRSIYRQATGKQARTRREPLIELALEKRLRFPGLLLPLSSSTETVQICNPPNP
jgi:hypothetical protein